MRCSSFATCSSCKAIRLHMMTTTKRHRNQYTSRDACEEETTSYEWLLSTLGSSQTFDSAYCCWIPSGIGISKTVAGYLRFNHGGRKHLCHVFIWRHHHPQMNEDGGDTSHLCRNKQCCRPTHLVKESRSANKSRDNCPGILSCSDHKDEAFLLCKHNPHCYWVTAFSCVRDKVEAPVKNE